jgi:hypothetical protein
MRHPTRLAGQVERATLRRELVMQIGCHLPTQGPVATRAALVTFARQAEAYQMASLWVSDHRDDLSAMLETLDLMTGEICPAVQTA